MLPLDSFHFLCKLIHIENNLCFPFSRELNFSPSKRSDYLVYTKLLENEISCLILLCIVLALFALDHKMRKIFSSKG